MAMSRDAMNSASVCTVLESPDSPGTIASMPSTRCCCASISSRDSAAYCLGRKLTYSAVSTGITVTTTSSSFMRRRMMLISHQTS